MPSLRTLVCRYAAPAVLLAVAAVQIYVVETTYLTPWEGGGFGMFSTVDAARARFVRTFLITPGGEVPVERPAYLDHYVRKLRVLPTKERAARMAGALARATWVADETIPSDTTAPTYRWRRSGSGPFAPERVAQVRAVRVEVWRYHFDTNAAKLRTERLVQATRP